nr:hypothetical protein [uncultured Draconibacterium sp.]
MIKDFIENDISRCNNYSCPINAYCARFRQIQVDRQKEDRSGFSTTTYDGDKIKGMCKHFLNVEK